MADPIDPNNIAAVGTAAEGSAASLEKFNAASAKTFEGLGMLDTAVDEVKTVFKSFGDSLSSVGINLAKTHTLTQQQTTQFGLLTAAVFGSRKAFDSLGEIDAKPLNTFTSQVQDLKANLLNNDGAFGEIVGMLKDKVPAGATKSVGALTGFLGALATSADNALRLQNAYIQLAAKTGTLGEIQSKAGPHFNNINALMAIQNSIMSQSQVSTGMSRESIEKYYIALRAVPKAMEELVQSGGATNSKVSMLTATIKYATGSGRDYGEVITDLKTAYRDYGLVGESALKFTARFSEISKKFGIELGDVRTGLLSASDAFKSIADTGKGAEKMVEGLANVMNNYVDSLKQTGMSGKQAVDTVTNMTTEISKMNVAKMAFLSSQTGGPGGLMGAAQIEKMMRSGDIEGVQKKVMQSMQKQFGKIVTLEEAQSSEGAAATRQKQIMMLQQGPMGSMIKNSDDAGRFLEAIRAKQEGKAVPTTALDSEGLQKTMATGTDLQKKQYTLFTTMNTHLATIARAAETSNLTLLQKGFAAGQGGGNTGTAMGTRISRTMRGGDVAGAAAVEDAKADKIVDKSGEIAASAAKDFYSFFEMLPKSLKTSFSAVAEAVSSGKKENVEVQKKKLQTEIADRRAKIANSDMSKEEKNIELKKVDEMEKGASMAGRLLDGKKKPVEAPSAKMLAGAPKGTPGSKAGPPAPVGAPGTATVDSNAGAITVHVTGWCLKCKNEMDRGKHSESISPVK